MSLGCRDFKLRFAAASNNGGWGSPVVVKFSDGTTAEVENVEWDESIESVVIDVIYTPNPPPVVEEPTDPDPVTP